MTASDDLPESVLIPGALFWSDGQRLVCYECAGFTASTTGRDLSGEKVRRVSIGDVQVRLADRNSMSCETGCTTITNHEGPDGWPVASGSTPNKETP